jgi:hypothetical protein
MSSISLYMATVMFGSDWLDVTNGGSKQLIFPMAKGTPMQMATRGAPSPKTPAKRKKNITVINDL